MQIIPGLGIEKIKLGLSKKKLIKLLGKADKIINEIEDTTGFIYNDMMISLAFNAAENDRLWSIETSHSNASLWNQKIIGMSKEGILHLLELHGIYEVIFHDYDGKLLAIQTFHPDTELWNKKIIGMRKADLEELLELENVKLKSYEDYVYFEVIFCEEIWGTFVLGYDRLKSIEFSLLNDEQGELIWPVI